MVHEVNGPWSSDKRGRERQIQRDHNIAWHLLGKQVNWARWHWQILPNKRDTTPHTSTTKQHQPIPYHILQGHARHNALYMPSVPRYRGFLASATALPRILGIRYRATADSWHPLPRYRGFLAPATALPRFAVYRVPRYRGPAVVLPRSTYVGTYAVSSPV